MPRPWASPMIERVKKWWDGKLFGLIENIYTPVSGGARIRVEGGQNLYKIYEFYAHISYVFKKNS